MADIRSYRREKAKIEQNRNDYRTKIKRHKLKNVYRVLLVVVALLAVAVLVFVQYKLHVYTGYDTVSTVLLENSAGAEDIRLHDSVLTYSKDGAHCTNTKGAVTWNQTYEIQDIIVKTCKNVSAIASYNGREIYVQDTKKQLGSISTTLPIKDVAVAANGNVTAVVADTDVTWINTYDCTGQLLFTGQAHMDESGYPVAISLSPNGIILAVTYVYVDAGMLKSNVVFYNFGPVGENMNDHVVGMYFYSDILIPEIQFVDDETAFAIGNDRIMIYKGNQTPTEKAGYLLNKEIQSVFYGDKRVGVVFVSDDTEHTYMMDVYDTSCKKVGTYYFDMDYTDIFFEEECFVIYNENECHIMTYDGKDKFNGFFSKACDLLFPAGGKFKYVLVTETSMDIIQLK